MRKRSVDSEEEQVGAARQHVSVPSWISVVAYHGVAYGVEREEQVFFEIGKPDQKIGFASRMGRQMLREMGSGTAKESVEVEK